MKKGGQGVRRIRLGVSYIFLLPFQRPIHRAAVIRIQDWHNILTAVLSDPGLTSFLSCTRVPRHSASINGGMDSTNSVHAQSMPGGYTEV